jgi:endonuclease G
MSARWIGRGPPLGCGPIAKTLRTVSLALLCAALGCRGAARSADQVAPQAFRADTGASAAIVWPPSDPTSPDPHTVFGEPIYAEHDEGHNVTRRYGAFTVYYDDRVLTPRWTAIKMTAAVADANSDFRRPRRFKPDPVLDQNGLAFTTHDDYKNRPETPRRWDRGHMVQFDDARGHGDQAGRDSFFTTNVCPQLAQLNQKAWLSLEQMCTEFARDYGRIWIFTGPLYDDDPQPFEEGQIVPAPAAVYKIVVHEDIGGLVATLAFVLPQAPAPRDADLTRFLVTIDEVERRTALDFLHELPDEVEDAIEAAPAGIWPDWP